MTAIAHIPSHNIPPGMMNRTSQPTNSQRNIPQPMYPIDSQLLVAATPGYFSESLGIVPDNINDIFPQNMSPNIPQTSQMPQMPQMPQNTQSTPLYHMQSTTNNPHFPQSSQIPQSLQNVSQPTQTPPLYNMQPKTNIPQNNPSYNFQNNNFVNNYPNPMYNYPSNNMTPNYGNTPNYGQGTKVPGMTMTGIPGMTKNSTVMSRLTTKIPGTRSMSGMTIVPKIEPKKNNQKKKEIVYPEFLSIIPNLTDDFWIKIMNSASIGIFPRTLTYKRNVLTYKKNQKITIDEELVGTDIEKCKQFITFLQNKMSIKSDMDDVRSTEKLQNSSTYLDNMYKSWDDVKKKKDREALLNNFIFESEKALNLTDEEAISFNESIYRAFYSGYINKSNIIISGGKISRITNLVFDFERRRLFVNNSESSIDRKKLDSGILSENFYLDSSMIINGSVTPVDLDKKLKSTVKT